MTSVQTRVRVAVLIVVFPVIVLLPLAGSMARWGGFPPGYGDFPAQEVESQLPFSATAFWIGVGFLALVVLLYAAPRLFGFRRTRFDHDTNTPEFAPLPRWFFVGLFFWFGSAVVFFGDFSPFTYIDTVLFVPVWWGSILVLDGVVYRRAGGHSMLADRPKAVALLALISSIGWFLFEYLNFFILSNWYYPNNHLFSNYGNIVWYLSSYTIIFPQMFELYHLFLTIPRLARKYARGPKITFGRGGYVIALAVGMISSVLMGYFPRFMFLTVWINPVLILFGVLGLLGIPTLFSPIREGDWGPVLLIGLAMVINGLMWEVVNFGSERMYEHPPVNPSYWKYAVPWVGRYRLPFTEMPILGYLGYIPYGWICRLQWTWAASLFGFNATVEVDELGTYSN